MVKKPAYEEREKQIAELNRQLRESKHMAEQPLNRDITVRKKNEEDSILSEKNHRYLFDNLQEGIWMIDENAYTTFVNPPMADMLGYTQDEMVGMLLFDFMDQEIAEEVKTKLQLLSQGLKEQREFEFIKKNGDKISTFLVATSLNDNGVYTGSLASVMDISKLKQVQHEVWESKERFRQLFENMNSGVAVYEPTDNGDDFIFKDFNKAAEKIEQIKRDDILGKRVTDVFPNVKEFGVFDVFQRVWKTGRAEYFKPHLYKGDRYSGSWREAWVYKLPSGEVVAIYNDITQRMRVENELKSSQELLSEITRQVPGVIYQFYSRPNGEMGLHYVSERAEKIFGLKPDVTDFFERFTELVVPEHKEAFLKSVQKAVKHVRQWGFEGTLQKPSGEYIVFSGHSTPSVRENEIVFNGIILDITEQRKAEEEHRKLQTQLLQSEKMASIGQLAAGVAHEINNPTGFVSSNLKTLNGYQEDLVALIKAYQSLVDFLKNPPESEKVTSLTLNKISEITELSEKIDIDFVLEDVQALVKECMEGTDRIKKIVIDLKDFSHPGEEEQQLADINKNIESTLNVIWNEIKYHVDVKKHLGQLPLVLCYPHQLNQVFMNLILNAAQAIQDRGEIIITTTNTHQNVMIEIQDTGSGIDKKHLAKIYEPFFTTKEVGKGTGLGLNVVYNIIQKHQGTIAVKSEVGKGTTFTLCLPVNNG